MSRMEGYSITPSLIILLKFLDGHLSLPTTYSSPLPSTLVPFLLERLEEFSNCILEEQGRGRDAADAQVFQGVVLVLHCLVGVGLGVEAEKSRGENLGEKGDEEWQEEGLRDEKGVETVIREPTAAGDRDCPTDEDKRVALCRFIGFLSKLYSLPFSSSTSPVSLNTQNRRTPILLLSRRLFQYSSSSTPETNLRQISRYNLFRLPNSSHRSSRSRTTREDSKSH